MTEFALTNLTLSAPNRGNCSVPEFMVRAPDSDTAIDIAAKIVLCGRLTSDGVLWQFAGSVRFARGLIIKTFTICMTE